MKNISILGSTGSIGTQTLEVIEATGCSNVIGISANRNIDLLEKQIREFKPKAVSVGNEIFADNLKSRLKDIDFDIEIYFGQEGLIKIATLDEVDMVLNSLVGSIGLAPTFEAIKNKKDIALANKETLVSAGELMIETAKENNANIYPVDSEHSAIFQCLQGNDIKDVSKIILTASGGPFRGKKKHELTNITKADALKHPNWSMGDKITIDSATLMNKGLEVIEARWLFDMPVEKIQVVVHPQSIIHSMVEFCDSSIIAQLGVPDMKTPIQYALTYPKRIKNDYEKLDFYDIINLTFEEPDYETFSCLNLAIEAIKFGGLAPCVLNGANEIAVQGFLTGNVKFLDISNIIEKTLSAYTVKTACSISDILETDIWAKEYAQELINAGNY